MFAIIFSIILIIVGIVVGCIIPGLRDEAPGKKFTPWPLLAALVISIALFIVSCIAVVPTGYTGILTTFGRVEERTVGSGINFIAPWQEVVKMDNRIQKQEFESAAFSSDLQEASYAVTINYSIDQTAARDIYKTVGTNYYETVMFGPIQDNIKTIFAKYTAESLIGNRDVLSQKVTESVAADMSRYGINVVSIAIRDIDFTDTFTTAVEAKQVAAQNKLKAETEQAQKTMEEEQTAKRAIIAANAEAEKAVIAANADLEVVKVQAEAALYAGEKEAEMNKRIGESLNGSVIDYYWIKQWDGKLPTTVLGDGNDYILDLGSVSATEN
jgi:regulator of protease activity HflC (stomatin/prohibitin superfamily)